MTRIQKGEFMKVNWKNMGLLGDHQLGLVKECMKGDGGIFMANKD